MLKNWIKPLSVNTLHTGFNKEDLETKNIYIYDHSLTDLSDVKIGLLGIGSQSNSIRNYLFQYAALPENVKLMDLGNIRKKNIVSILPVLKELHDSGIMCIIVDAEGLGPKLLFEHYQSVNNVFHPLIIDECLRLDDSSFSLDFLNKKMYKCLNVNLLGSQMHKMEIDLNDNYQVKNLRIGKMRGHKEAIEATMRNGHFCYFNLNAVKKSEAPGKTGTNPSGLFSEDAAQVARYAGLGEHLSSFMIGGFWHIESQTAELISQMIWYLIDGFSKRTQDKIDVDTSVQEYIVDIKNPSVSLTFIKSEKSGRWWFKLPIEIGETQAHRHIPCTYLDYQAACNEEVSDLVMEAIENH